MGLKQTEPNPWDLISSKYRVGDRIKGTVRNITDFGAFIEVEEGIDGLVHISDLSWTKRIKHPSEVLNKSDEVEAVILKIDSDNQRLSLGIKQLQPNVLEEFFQTHSTGMVLTGKIVRLTDFGAFVELFEGVEGLVHVSELSNERIENPEDSFSVGQEVRVKVIKVDPIDKKIGLSIKAALNEPDSASVQAYFDNRGGDGSATLGDLMDPTMFRPDSSEEAAQAAPREQETGAAAEPGVSPAEAAADEKAEAPAEESGEEAKAAADEDAAPRSDGAGDEETADDDEEQDAKTT